jgi:hypothetical protein
VRAESLPPADATMRDEPRGERTEVERTDREWKATPPPAARLSAIPPARAQGWGFVTSFLTLGPIDFWTEYAEVPPAVHMCQAIPRHR